jgi:hypothetical protein
VRRGDPCLAGYENEHPLISSVAFQGQWWPPRPARHREGGRVVVVGNDVVVVDEVVGVGVGVDPVVGAGDVVGDADEVVDVVEDVVVVADVPVVVVLAVRVPVVKVLPASCGSKESPDAAALASPPVHCDWVMELPWANPTKLHEPQ